MVKQLWIGGLVLLLGGAPGLTPPAIATPDTVEQLFERGHGALDREEYVEAERLFREALRLDPTNADLHVDLGIALGRQWKLEEAIASYREALRLDPHLAAAHNNLGNVLLLRGQVADAIASYRQALAALDDPATTPNPAHAAAHLGLGYSLYLRDEPGDLEAAIESYDRAIAIVPDFPEAQELRRMAQERLDSRHP